MENSPLARLPAEIRNEIYALVFIPDDDKPCSIVSPFPALTMTCHKIRFESLNVHYSVQSSFEVFVTSKSTRFLIAWLDALPKSTFKQTEKFKVNLHAKLPLPGRMTFMGDWGRLAKAVVGKGIEDKMEWAAKFSFSKNGFYCDKWDVFGMDMGDKVREWVLRAEKEEKEKEEGAFSK